MTQQKYPDISDLLEAKARRRRELAALSWEEKIEIVRQMQSSVPKDAWTRSPGTSVKLVDGERLVQH
jgi:hypothetical protein